RLEQGSAGTRYTQRHISAAARARRRDRPEERRLVASRRRPDPIPAPVGKGGDLAGALDRNERAAIAAPVGQIVGAARAEDPGGRSRAAGGLPGKPPRPGGAPNPRPDPRYRGGTAL